MKGLKKVLAVTMALGTALSMTACGLGEKRDEFDPNKTTLQVGLMEGGIGRVWMDEIIANYTAKNPDVQVKVVPQKDLYNHNNLLNSISTSGVDVYFVNGIYLNEFVTKGYLMDITELVGQQYEGKDSILDRMNVDVLKESYKINDKYYAIPYYMASLLRIIPLRTANIRALVCFRQVLTEKRIRLTTVYLQPIRNLRN